MEERSTQLSWRGSGILVLVLAASLVSVIGYSLWFVDDASVKASLQRRRAIAEIGAVTLEGNLDRLKDVAVSLATRVRFRELIQAGDWDGAAKTLEGSLPELSYIDRISLTDSDGVLMADVPALAGVRGQDFSHRDWYRGVSRDWAPYISEVYMRAAEPQYNVISAAAPIWGDDGTLLGILVLQIRTDVLFGWLSDVDLGTDGSGFIYFVDSTGHPVGYPDTQPQDPILDFSNVSFVRELLGGQRGLAFSNEADGGPEYLVAYEPLDSYGWGVVVAENVASVFSARWNTLLGVSIPMATIIGIYILLLVLLMRATARANDVSCDMESRVKSRTRLLEREHARLHAVIDNMVDGVVTVDGEGRISNVNAAAVRLLGGTEGDWVGLPHADLIRLFDAHGDVIAPASSPLSLSLSGKTVRWLSVPAAALLERRDGTRIPVTLTCAPMREGKAIVGAVAVVRDARGEWGAERAKSDFVNLVSHQLRTPLTAIQWYAQDMLDGSVGGMTPRQKAHAKEIDRSTRRVIRLIGDLLRVSQLELGQIRANPRAVDASSLVRDVAGGLRPFAEERGIAIRTEGTSRPVVARIDPDIVRQVLGALLSNAISYTPAGGSVTIRVKREGRDVLISVQDTGIGIPVGEQERVFERFFRASNAQSFAPEGTGLGLYVTKRLVAKTGGEIKFASIEGKGSTFTVLFPSGRAVKQKSRR